jgi:hypothetical protein
VVENPEVSGGAAGTEVGSLSISGPRNDVLGRERRGSGRMVGSEAIQRLAAPLGGCVVERAGWQDPGAKLMS